jgi:predicted extracellular nuclease
MAVWINEFHYDNTGTDAGEFIEVAGTAGTDLTGWSLVLYNGNGGAPYVTSALSGTIANQSNGFGTVSISYPSNGIQNGAPDAIALVDNLGAVVQFLSYEGTMTGVGGAANGVLSVDVGVFEAGTEPAGGSLHLTGTGDEYSDFTWSFTPDDSPGAVNTGQSFGAAAVVTVTVNDVSVFEGNSGLTQMVFTVTRSDNSGDFTVDFATELTGNATAPDFLGPPGTLTFVAGGELSKTIVVGIAGDTDIEPDETFTLRLSNIQNTTGTATITDDAGIGTILNDDVVLTEIAAIQGAGHRSALITTNTGSGTGVAQAGNSGANRYNVEGVVTALTTNGFWMQDPTPDADIATSDGIFVFTSSAPAGLAVGETVRVLNARVDEFRAGTTSGTNNNLTITQLNASLAGASVQDLGGNTVIAPVVLGTDRIVPNGTIDDDGLASFDPTTDAIDFWESLEGMVVQVPQSVAVSPTGRFGTSEEIWVSIPGNGDGPSTPAGAPLLGPTDANPERIQLDDLLNTTDLGDVGVGATLGPINGVVSYDFQNYEVLVGAAPTVVTPSPLVAETTTVTADARQITFGSYNVENLDPSDGAAKYAVQAAQIVGNLGAPTIVALQEVQDDNGAVNDGTVSADITLQLLVDAIFAESGLTYAFAYENPVNNQDGGEPGGNIRTAFLYRADLVTLNGTRRLLDTNPGEADGFAGDDFASSRKPLVGDFSFNGVDFSLINIHFNSKGGDGALFGNQQPPVLVSEAQRIQQALIVNAEVNRLLSEDSSAKVVVLGDVNDFLWSLPNTTLDGSAAGNQVLTDLALLLPENERYSYNFAGSAQELDHTLATDSLMDEGAPVYDIVHVNAEFANQASDHDPAVARFDFRAFGELLMLGEGSQSVDGMGGADSLYGEQGMDTLQGGAGDDIVDGGINSDLLYGGAGNDVIYVDDLFDRVLEGIGGGADTVISTVSVTVGRYVEATVLAGSDALRVKGNELANLIIGNDGGNQVNGGLENDTVDGAGGADRLFGEGGADSLQGGVGNDSVVGGDGADTIDGGAGRDVLNGGADADLFIIAALPGAGEGDTFQDFVSGVDRLGLAGSVFGFYGFESNTSGQAATTNGTVVFESDVGRLWWDTDGAGAGRTLLGQFINGGVVTAGDIILV